VEDKPVLVVLGCAGFVALDLFLLDGRPPTFVDVLAIVFFGGGGLLFLGKLLGGKATFALLAVAVIGVALLARRSAEPAVSPVTALRGTSAQPKVVGAALPVAPLPLDIALSPDGRRAYLTHRFDPLVSILDTATGSVSTIPVGVLPKSIAVSPDGRRAYVTAQGTKVDPDDAVLMIDTAAAAVIGRVPVGERPGAIAVAPDGAVVYVIRHGSAGGTGRGLSVISTATNDVVKADLTFAPNDVAVSPHGTTAYVSSCADNSVSMIDTRSGRVTASVPVGVCPGALAVGRDGRRVYVADSGTDLDPGTTVSVIDTVTESRVATVPVGVRPSGVAVSPDGRYAYVTNSGSAETPGNSVTVIDTATATPSDTIAVTEDPVAVAFAPDGRRAYVAGSAKGAVSVIDPGVR
jgi:YVTN family beta-propeller protein